jgi:hypothetical protein
MWTVYDEPFQKCLRHDFSEAVIPNFHEEMKEQ